ncbi:MAG: winged helix-turn-helix transcriptional regulator [Chloroflexi bacterium]|nr:winged helix-turn-helix transcriptional regulator [Chloroflexota bacterium]
MLDDVVDRIVALYRSAGRALRAADPVDWAAGLTMPQLRVLFFLGRAGPASVGEVAAGVSVAQPSATETLDRLVRAGLVERTVDACDRRVARNALTAAGQDVIDRPWEMRRAVLASALRRASPRERLAIARGLELLNAALQRLEGPPQDVEQEEQPKTGKTHGETKGEEKGSGNP